MGRAPGGGNDASLTIPAIAAGRIATANLAEATQVLAEVADEVGDPVCAGVGRGILDDMRMRPPGATGRG